MKRIVLTLLLMALLVGTLVACGETDDADYPDTSVAIETPEPEETPEPPELEEDVEEDSEEEAGEVSVPSTGDGASTDLTNIENYWIELDGVRFSAGDSFARLYESFTVNPREEELLDTTLAPNRYVLVTFFHVIDDRLGEGFSALIANVTDDDILVREGSIFGFRFDSFAAERFEQHSFMNGIQIGVSTKDEVVAMLGEPADIIETDSFRHVATLYYRPIQGNFNTDFQFTFDMETGVLDRVRFTFFD